MSAHTFKVGANGDRYTVEAAARMARRMVRDGERWGFAVAQAAYVTRWSREAITAQVEREDAAGGTP